MIFSMESHAAKQRNVFQFGPGFLELFYDHWDRHAAMGSSVAAAFDPIRKTDDYLFSFSGNPYDHLVEP